ncbi:cyclin [Aspergillus campestris IBT 28561]|uniref:Cyclin n=1 Tax=Aspergillus campestris (strain IBT 28561) TaxID=1392248 RepID=A0A2I1D0J2_ASPC2|nr:cyclin [Aspergillus campestris IBT 28561]PKY03387.1 cyclin [Aspergillus campestris IBT 28561]
MDFYLRCNSLKCRSQLKERAVVTTCSYDNLGLSRPDPGERRCPACQAILINPDDAVATILNPTEDYKTSVLSGLDPNTIMECAGRALLFWTYQSSQEIFYQEFLGKTLTEKYTNLNTQMDKVVHNANTEIATLQAKLSEMQDTHEQLGKKNQELADLYREKCKKFTQITNLYNLLKTRAMRSQMQTAASDSVSQALRSLAPPQAEPHSAMPPLPAAIAGPPPQTPSSRQQSAFPVDTEGVEQLHRYQRSGTGSSRGTKRRAAVSAMAPPSRPVGAIRNDMPQATPKHRTRLTGPPRSSRPSTGLSQLPQDRVMYERFQGEAGVDHRVCDGGGSIHAPPNPREGSGLRMYFDRR